MLLKTTPGNPELVKKSQKNKQRKYSNIGISQLPLLEVEQCVRILKQSHWQMSKITAVPYPAEPCIRAISGGIETI